MKLMNPVKMKTHVYDDVFYDATLILIFDFCAFEVNGSEMTFCVCVCYHLHPQNRLSVCYHHGGGDVCCGACCCFDFYCGDAHANEISFSIDFFYLVEKLRRVE